MSIITADAARQLTHFGENWIVGNGVPAAELELAHALVREMAAFKQLVTELAVLALVSEAADRHAGAQRRALRQLQVVRHRAAALGDNGLLDAAAVSRCLDELTHWLEELLAGRGNDGMAMDGVAEGYRRLRLHLKRHVPSELVSEGLPVFTKERS
jgi:hypothetical protein